MLNIETNKKNISSILMNILSFFYFFFWLLTSNTLKEVKKEKRRRTTRLQSIGIKFIAFDKLICELDLELIIH